KRRARRRHARFSRRPASPYPGRLAFRSRRFHCLAAWRGCALKTTKCDSEKLTTKLARMANALAISTGSNKTSARTRSVVVLAIHPATREPKREKKPPQPGFPPVSAAKVTYEFMTYEPVTETIHAIVFAAIRENIAAPPHLHSADSEANAA